MDRTTKLILTVIAVSLSAIALENSPILRQARADSQVHVYLDGVNSYAFQYISTALPVHNQ